jgi:hypothetical protein
VKDEANNMIIADIAGLSELNNEFIDFINTFIDRYIFLKAEKLRFLVPISRDQNSNKQVQAIRS